MGTGKRQVDNMLEQPLYYKMIAEAVISNADGILDAIDRYLPKADLPRRKRPSRQSILYRRM